MRITDELRSRGAADLAREVEAGEIPADARIVKAHGSDWLEWPAASGRGVTRAAVGGSEWRTATALGTARVGPSSRQPAKTPKRRMKGSSVPVLSVRVRNAAWRKIEAMKLDGRDEVVAVLWGRRLNSTLVVEAALEVSKGGTPVSVGLDVEATQQEDKRQAKLGRELLGFAHQHPSSKGWTNHSDADLKLLRRISMGADGRAALSIILSQDDPIYGMKPRGWKRPSTTVVVARFDTAGKIHADHPVLRIDAPGTLR